MAIAFTNLALPFRWLPELEPGQHLQWIDLKISVYPDFHPLWDGQFFAVPIYCYFLEGQPPRVVTERHRLCFYHMRMYPPLGSRPSGLYCWSTSRAIQLSGEAEVTF